MSASTSWPPSTAAAARRQGRQGRREPLVPIQPLLVQRDPLDLRDRQELLVLLDQLDPQVLLVKMEMTEG